MNLINLLEMFQGVWINESLRYVDRIVGAYSVLQIAMHGKDHVFCPVYSGKSNCSVSMAGTVVDVLSHAESAHPKVPLPKASADNTSKNKLDESFFDMLMRCQVSILIADILVFAVFNTFYVV